MEGIVTVEAVSALIVALFLATINERLVEWFIAPLVEKAKVDTLWLRYVAGLTGAVIALFAGVNLFPLAYVPAPYLGQVLTAIIVGGGSNLVHELFSNAAKRASVYDKVTNMKG